MKGLRFSAFAIAISLIALVCLTSCQKKNVDDVLSHIDSSEITSSVASASQQSQDNSSKPGQSSKPETSSEPEISSENESTTSLKPSSRPSQNTSEVTSTSASDYDRIVGKWSATIDISKELSNSGFDVSSAANVEVIYDFSATNNAVIKMEETSYKSAINPIVETTLRNAIMKQYGMSLEEFAVQYNTTVDALIESSMNKAIKNLSQVYAYKFENSLLWMNNTSTLKTKIYRYTFIDNDTLSLTFIEDNHTAIFTRVK